MRQRIDTWGRNGVKLIMPFWELYYHFTWGTKLRQPIISNEFSVSLNKAMTSKAVELGAIVHAVGGIEDHVHLAVSVPPKISLSEFVRQIKGKSSHFVNHEIKQGYFFQWQSEYGVVSFGGKNLLMVVSYVLNQREHHRNKTLYEYLEQISG